MVKIGNKKFALKLLITDESKRKGLKGVKASSMPKSSGVALIFKKPSLVSITMKGMQFPIDLIYVLEDKVVGLGSMNVGDLDKKIPKKVTAVIELHKGASSGIKVGDNVIGEVEQPTVIKEGGVKAEQGKLHVLDNDGKNQKDIAGRERIISRVHTNQLYNAAKKANKTKKDRDYRTVGRAVIRIVNKQNTQKQLYTND